MKDLKLYFDGGNEGKLAVYGVVGYSDGKTVVEIGGVCDQSLPQTNNVAEWTALYYAMVYAFSVRDDYDNVVIYGDSELIVKQINGEYACKNPHLVPFYAKSIKMMLALSAEMVKYKILWIPREQNERADEVGREARSRFNGV